MNLEERARLERLAVGARAGVWAWCPLDEKKNPRSFAGLVCGVQQRAPENQGLSSLVFAATFTPGTIRPVKK
jgi:hypothetical protein